jgi:hypothetical protein
MGIRKNNNNNNNNVGNVVIRSPRALQPAATPLMNKYFTMTSIIN